MPAYDIMPFRSPHGGTYEVREGSMTSGASWLVGHPVMVVDAGTVSSVPHDTTEALLTDADNPGNIFGIACQSVGQDDGDGTVSTGGAINPQTGIAYAAGDNILFWPFDQGIEFITSNFHDTATTSAVVPALTDIGEAYLLSSSATAAAGYGFGLEQTAGTLGTEVFAVVNDVLDTNKAPIRRTGGTGVYLVFELKTTVGASA